MSDSEDTGSSDASIVTQTLRVVVPDAIRRRFALKFVIVLLIMGVTIVGVGYLGTQEVASATENRIQDEYRSFATSEGNVLNQWVERNRETTRLASQNPAWSSDNSTYMSNQLVDNTMQHMSNDVTRLRIFNETADGEHYFVASTTGGVGFEVGTSRMAWATEIEFDGHDDVAISPVYRSEGSGQEVISFVSPAGDTNRTMIVEVALSSIAAEFQGSDRVSGGFTQVVNGSGTVVIDETMGDGSTQESDFLAQYGDQRPVDEAAGLTDEPSGVLSNRPANDQIMDEPYAVGYAPVILPGTSERWFVLVHAPRGELFADARSISQTGLLVTGGLGLLIVLIGAVLGFNTSRSIDRLTGKAEEMEEGNLDVDIDSGRIDNIGRLYDGFANMRDALREQIEEAEQARKEAEVSRAEAMEMNEYLQETAEEYSRIMQACARGDLTQRMTEDGENESMDQIAREFNEMITELEMTTGQLKTFASEVEQSGQSVQQSAETVRDASEQVADSIQKISDDAYDQKERLRDISEEMDDVATQLENYADDHDVDISDALESIREVATMIDEAADLGEETMTESENVAGAAEEQAAELNEVSARAEELTRYAQYLGDGLGNFETEEEHEFVFQTGSGGPGAGTGAEAGDEGDEE